ncbi:hypothetical protein Hdeb2414_s0005g00157721 [Helianthus debilis subsp. tardiflorus]
MNPLIFKPLLLCIKHLFGLNICLIFLSYLCFDKALAFDQCLVLLQQWFQGLNKWRKRSLNILAAKIRGACMTTKYTKLSHELWMKDERLGMARGRVRITL